MEKARLEAALEGGPETETVFSCHQLGFQTGVTSPPTGLHWEDRATPRQAGEGPEDLGGAPLACTLALSRPLAPSQNKLFNATVSVSCEKRPFQIWRMSPLLRLSQKS